MKTSLAALLVAAIILVGCAGPSPIQQASSPAPVLPTLTPKMPTATSQATNTPKSTATITATLLPLSPVEELDADLYSLDGGPYRFAVVEDAIWVGMPGDNTVRRIDVKSKQETAKITVGWPCSNFSVGFDSVWVVDCNNDKLVRIDTKTSTVTAQIELNSFMVHRDMMSSEDGIWLVRDEKGILARIDPATNQITDEYEVNPKSHLVVASFDSVWLAKYADIDDGTIQRLDPKTKQVIATINAGKNPLQLEVAEGAVWEYSYAEGAIYRIDPTTNKFEVFPVFDPWTWAYFAVSDGTIFLTTGTRLLVIFDTKTKQITRQYGAPTSSEVFYIRVYDGTVWILRGSQGSSTNAIWRVNKPE